MSEMNAGRELDALVAEKVMGADVVVRDGRAYINGNPYDRLPNYSTDIAHAWQIVERMADWRVVIERVPSGEWEVMFDTRRVFENVKADTLPLAICRAALAAVGAP
jgi:hypothetical protein